MQFLLPCLALVVLAAARVAAQEREANHRVWVGSGVGYASLASACDSCTGHIHRGWPALKVAIGLQAGPRVRVGTQFEFWLDPAHPSRRGAGTATVGAWLHPHGERGLVFRTGLGLCQYSDAPA